MRDMIATVVDKHEIDGVFNLLVGDRHNVGDLLLNDKRIPLVSATSILSL